MIKNIFIVFTLFIFCSFFGQQNANDILLKVHTSITKDKNFSYDLAREINYKSTKYKNLIEWSNLIEFTKDSEIGFRFQISSAKVLHIYNGKEFFSIDKKEKSLKITKEPNYEFFESMLSPKIRTTI